MDGSDSATCSPASGSWFSIDDTVDGTAHTVTCGYTDAHGNIATSMTFTVTVTGMYI